jgi:Zn ribbon nucleic-acid-binding protein
MYINIYIPVKCSKCGAIDNYEDVTRNGTTIRRCLKCGHKNIMAQMFVYPDNDKPIYYEHKQPEYFDF